MLRKDPDLARQSIAAGRVIYIQVGGADWLGRWWPIDWLSGAKLGLSKHGPVIHHPSYQFSGSRTQRGRERKGERGEGGGFRRREETQIMQLCTAVSTSFL